MKYILMLCGILAMQNVGASDLKLEMQGTGLAGQMVLIALYTSAKDFPDGTANVRQEKVLATGDVVNFLIAGLPSGEYAVVAFADSNGNGKLDRNFVGKPTEAYGFSRNARGIFGPPSFSDAAFKLSNDMTVMPIELR